ncbi:putative transposase [Quadrisphaera granulorum]|uniref:Putative transposase n=1 Tax=Quadrisphaera granulorum TaxID=317664 RepID=A0A316A503_9ACTN|nr:RNA-guided endonuclease TnpB family protein [Quadrisphaera granulorum]PWJ52996.1 putative transposase [Quadrisphaera granulorum]SZE97161.1 putative transposase [Quadrisphaera granulorum]
MSAQHDDDGQPLAATPSPAPAPTLAPTAVPLPVPTPGPGPVVRAYRLALDPTPTQATAFARHAGASRWAFNYALAAKKAAHAACREQVDALTAAGVPEAEARKAVKVEVPGAFTVQKTWQHERTEVCPWWGEVSSKAFVQAFRDADKAWTNWLASLKGQRAGHRVGYPRFKKRGRCRDSFRLEGAIRPEGYRHLLLPRIGPVRTHQTCKPLARALERQGGRITSVTVSRGAHRWYASVVVTFPSGTLPTPQRAAPTRAQQRAGVVGVDLGVKHLAALSALGADGTLAESLVANPRHGARGARRLAKAQRALSRTQRGSHRRAKAAAIVARRHADLAAQRATSIHVLTKHLATTYAGVAIEDLHVSGMTRSAKGSLAKPGRNVRAKAGLNRSLADVSFGEIRRQLAYKTRWYGSTLRVVGRFEPTSKTCSACGRQDPHLSLAERIYECPCGLRLDRDLNAARNIRVAGFEPAAWAAAVARGSRETSNARRGPASPHTRPGVGLGPLTREDHPDTAAAVAVGVVTSGR